jgi:hypothetical protein
MKRSNTIHGFRVEPQQQRLDRASVATVLDRLPLRRDEDCDRIAGIALIAMKEDNVVGAPLAGPAPPAGVPAGEGTWVAGLRAS